MDVPAYHQSGIQLLNNNISMTLTCLCFSRDQCSLVDVTASLGLDTDMDMFLDMFRSLAGGCECRQRGHLA